MPLRINAYAALATERYNLPVFLLLINILPNSQNEKIPSVYHSEVLGMMSHQDYRVINLWEVNVNLVFEQQLTALLPFVPILKGGGNEAKVRQAVQSLKINETLAELEPLLSFFASFVLEIPLVQQTMRWDMVVLSESPWYQEIMKEGERSGLQQGESSLILRQISHRFGAIEPSLELKIKRLSLPELESLGENLFDFPSANDVIFWLNQVDN